MYPPKLRRAGFSLTELLVVLAIISVLSGIVLVNANAARNKGKNARAVADVSQYMTGLALARERNGSYPLANSFVCLGPSGATCFWGGGTPFYTSTTVRNALNPVMSSLPASTYRVGNYQGYSYQSTGGTSYTLRWFLYGEDRTCEIGTRTGNATGISLCQYTR